MQAGRTCWLERPLGCILVFVAMPSAGGALGSYVLLGWACSHAHCVHRQVQAGPLRASCPEYMGDMRHTA